MREHHMAPARQLLTCPGNDAGVPEICRRVCARVLLQNTVPSDIIKIGGSLVFGLETSANSRPPCSQY